MVKRMPAVLGALMALAALTASIFAGVDSVSCLVRGAGAYFAGVVLAHLWNIFLEGVLRRKVVDAPTAETEQEKPTEEETLETAA